MLKYYRCKYCFNALHSMDRHNEKVHLHTFTVYLSVSARFDDIATIDFHNLDEIVNSVLQQYTGVTLNKLDEFQDRLPSIENIGEILYDKFKAVLTRFHYILYRLEIRENPIAEYSVSERFLLPMEYLADCKEYWADIIDMKSRQ